MSNVDAQPDDAGSNPIIAEESPKSRRAFDRVTRELSDDDLNSAGAQKLLLEDRARLLEENATLTSFEARFHESDKRNSVLEEKLKTRKVYEIISTATIAIGSVSIGYANSLRSTPFWYVIAFGIALFVVGIVAKVIGK